MTITRSRRAAPKRSGRATKKPRETANAGEKRPANEGRGEFDDEFLSREKDENERWKTEERKRTRGGGAQSRIAIMCMDTMRRENDDNDGDNDEDERWRREAAIFKKRVSKASWFRECASHDCLKIHSFICLGSSPASLSPSSTWSRRRLPFTHMHTYVHAHIVRYLHGHGVD